MMRYEILMLAVPEITNDEARSLETQLDRIIKKAKGTVISFERWGKYRLAYPVKKNEYGVYFLTRFEAEEANEMLDGLRAYFTLKANDLIMRHMCARLDEKASLDYDRPPSLEMAPHDGSSFIKDAKVNDLLAQGASGRDDEDDTDSMGEDA